MKMGSPDWEFHSQSAIRDSNLSIKRGFQWKSAHLTSSTTLRESLRTWNKNNSMCDTKSAQWNFFKINLTFDFLFLSWMWLQKRNVLAPSIMKIFCHSITLSVALPKSSRRSSVSESFFSSSLHTAGAFFVPFSEMVGVFSPFAEVDFGFLWIKGHFKNGQTKLQAISLNLYVFL